MLLSQFGVAALELSLRRTGGVVDGDEHGVVHHVHATQELRIFSHSLHMQTQAWFVYAGGRGVSVQASRFNVLIPATLYDISAHKI